MASGTIKKGIEEISVTADNASTPGAIQYNHSAFSTLNRSYARRIGNVVIFSFVGTTATNTTPSTVLFAIESGYQPKQQVDFVVLASGTAGAVPGQLVVSGTTAYINVNASVSSSLSIRGEVMWVIE